MNNHTPTLWKADHTSLSPRSAVYANTAEGQVVIAMCEEEGDAAFIVRAVNAHKALVDALKVAQCEIDQRGTVDREMVQARISDALKLANGEA